MNMNMNMNTMKSQLGQYNQEAGVDAERLVGDG